jgi:hypothetical protein
MEETRRKKELWAYGRNGLFGPSFAFFYKNSYSEEQFFDGDVAKMVDGAPCSTAANGVVDTASKHVGIGNMATLIRFRILA